MNSTAWAAAVPELVRDGETGLLVPPRTPAALAAATSAGVVVPQEALEALQRLLRAIEERHAVLVGAVALARFGDRELRGVLGDTPKVDIDAIPEHVKQLDYVKEGAEREYLVGVMQKYHGNIRKICQEMQLSRSRVYQLLNKFHLQAADYR